MTTADFFLFALPFRFFNDIIFPENAINNILEKYNEVLGIKKRTERFHYIFFK